MRAAIIVAALGLAACAGELEQPERFASCPPGFVEQLFQTRCAGCHGATSPDAELDLVSPGVEGRLIGELSKTEFCAERMLIEPEAGAGAHLLVDKLSETPSCGARMPFGGAALSASEVECVRRWVDEAVAP